MEVIARAVRGISAVNRAIGLVFSWLALGIVLVCFSVVVYRYVLRGGTIWMQDLYIWLSGAMFTAVSGFALLRDDHVRVDIYYRQASLRWRAIADLSGVVVFLVPFMLMVFIYGWPYVTRSWRIWEGSANVGGMPGLFVLKTFILIFAGLVLLQGLAMLGRSILVLGGKQELLPESLRYKALTAAEAHTEPGAP